MEINKVKKILVAIDNSRMSQEALKRAILIAKEKNAKLYIIHIVESSFLEPVLIRPVDEETLKRNITEQIESLNKESKLDYVLYVDSGSPSSLITSKAKKLKVELLVVGVNGKNDIASEYFGSTALKLIQNTNIPVLVVKNEVKDSYKKILAPTNLTNYSKESILFATTLFDTALRKCISALEPLYEFQVIDNKVSIEKKQNYKKELFKSEKIKLDKFVEGLGNFELELIEEDLSINEDLLEYINKDDSDLLVLGSKGVYDLNSFIFGSTATYLMQKSPIDILVYVPLKSQQSSSQTTKGKISAIEQDLQSRKDEIRADLESLFEEHLKIANWNIPEAEDQKIAKGLSLILEEKLNEIKQKIKEGRYQEKRTDFWK